MATVTFYRMIYGGKREVCRTWTFRWRWLARLVVTLDLGAVHGKVAYWSELS